MKIIKLDVINKSVMKCKASIDHQNGLITHEWKIIAKDGQLEEVVVPQIRSGVNFIDVLEFTDTKVLEEIKKLILSAYNDACNDANDLNNEELAFYIKKGEPSELHKRIARLEVAMSSDFQILRRYQQQDSDGVNLAPDMTLFRTERELFDRLLHLLGINVKTLQYNDLIYSKETFRDNGFISWIEANRAEFSGIVSIPKKENLEKDPLRFVSKLLKLVGLKQTRTGRASNGTYIIDTEQLNFIRSIIAKRATASLVSDRDEADYGFAGVTSSSGVDTNAGADVDFDVTSDII